MTSSCLLNHHRFPFGIAYNRWGIFPPFFFPSSFELHRPRFGSSFKSLVTMMVDEKDFLLFLFLFLFGPFSLLFSRERERERRHGVWARGVRWNEADARAIASETWREGERKRRTAEMDRLPTPSVSNRSSFKVANHHQLNRR